MSDILEIDGLRCGYNMTLLGPLDLTVEAGRFVLIEGPNGIGKSTLMKTLVGLLPPYGGTFHWDVPDEQLRFVPQVRTLDPILPATVADVIATGTQQGAGWKGLRKSATSDEIGRALQRVSMGDARNRLFRELSEGQKQLVLLARALMGEVRVLLLDEPTASMDPEREQQAVELLDGQRRERKITVMTIAHGSDAAREASDARLTIDRDRNVAITYDEEGG